jgi:phospholipase A-2-activating protein
VQKAGTKEGQVQMIREQDGSVTAHTWSSGDFIPPLLAMLR